jgi:hypothetical protein
MTRSYLALGILFWIFCLSAFGAEKKSIPGFESVEHPMGAEFYVNKADPLITILVKREPSSDVIDLTKATSEEQDKFLEITWTVRNEANKSIGIKDWKMSDHKITPTSEGHIFEFNGTFTDFEGRLIEFIERQYRTNKGLVKIYTKKPETVDWPSSLDQMAQNLHVWLP